MFKKIQKLFFRNFLQASGLVILIFMMSIIFSQYVTISFSITGLLLVLLYLTIISILCDILINFLFDKEILTENKRNLKITEVVLTKNDNYNDNEILKINIDNNNEMSITSHDNYNVEVIRT